MLEEILKKYIEQQIEQDAAYKAVYDPKKLKDCAKYVQSMARKQSNNGCAMVEDAVVFKWCRDFFYGDIEDVEPAEASKVTVSDTPVEEKPAENEEEETEVSADKLEIISVEDNSEDTEIEVKERTVIKQKKKKVNPDNLPDQASLFDFEDLEGL